MEESVHAASPMGMETGSTPNRGRRETAFAAALIRPLSNKTNIIL